eukprot:COSAG01_NODE_17040_length_1183_cov_1.070111_1_plen_226_part_01
MMKDMDVPGIVAWIRNQGVGKDVQEELQEAAQKANINKISGSILIRLINTDGGLADIGVRTPLARCIIEEAAERAQAAADPLVAAGAPPAAGATGQSSSSSSSSSSAAAAAAPTSSRARARESPRAQPTGLAQDAQAAVAIIRPAQAEDDLGALLRIEQETYEQGGGYELENLTPLVKHTDVATINGRVVGYVTSMMLDTKIAAKSMKQAGLRLAAPKKPEGRKHQ